METDSIESTQLAADLRDIICSGDIASNPILGLVSPTHNSYRLQQVNYYPTRAFGHPIYWTS